MQNFTGAIFDLDGTLVDSLFLWEVIWARLGETFGRGADFRPNEADEKAVRTMTLEGAMEFIHQRYGLGESGAALLRVLHAILWDFYQNEVELKEGVLPFLEACRARGVKMCIASATDVERIQLALAHTGIAEYFTAVLSCADIGKGKDEPDIYELALATLGTPREETCVFEDSLVALKTAKSIGLLTVGIYDENNFGHAEMEKIVTAYIGKGETLEKLL